MGSAVQLSELYRFRVAGTPLNLYKRVGESYEHVLMKALGYALFLPAYPKLEVERAIGSRYKPDLVALNSGGGVDFWGECGDVGLRKIGWLAKHSGARRIAFFKIGQNQSGRRHLTALMQREVEERYRPPGRLTLINFEPTVIDRAIRELDEVPARWYQSYDI